MLSWSSSSNRVIAEVLERSEKNKRYSASE
jgi:hypothetical protein